MHHDSVNRMLRPRKGARLTAITSGGAIPDNADYRVLLEPEGLLVGTVNEDFAVESLQGDVFQLGNASYRILRVERGTVRVEDAHGQPPSIPFWLGEAPGRTVGAVRGGRRACAPEIGRAARRPGGGAAQLARSRPSASMRPAALSSSTIWPRGAPRCGACPPSTPSSSSASSTSPAACSWSSIPPSAAA